MQKPTFPLPPGKYLVTGGRQVTTVLTIHPKDKDGNERWELADGATLYDVTHLGCRSARYTPATGNHSCSPANVQAKRFPVNPGAAMPPGERLPQAGLCGSHRDWPARHSLIGFFVSGTGYQIPEPRRRRWALLRRHPRSSPAGPCN